jgi:hypothetical protein
MSSKTDRLLGGRPAYGRNILGDGVGAGKHRELGFCVAGDVGLPPRRGLSYRTASMSYADEDPSGAPDRGYVDHNRLGDFGVLTQ